ncbi:MAG: ATP phosphoribosyltransferase regulatory subunit, partial [Actinobacteria bacterium]
MNTAPMTPRGFRDALPAEAAEREALLAALARACSLWGYDPVETPVIERWDVLAAGAGAAIERDAFRLTDLDGTLLALRPEVTLPVARMAATALAGDPRP